MTDGKAIKKGELWEEYNSTLNRAYIAMRRSFQRSGLTQDQLAAKLGVDKGLISKRLKGVENLTLKTLSFMANAMGCRLEINYVPYSEGRRPEKLRAQMIVCETGVSTIVARGFYGGGDIEVAGGWGTTKNVPMVELRSVAAVAA